MTDWPGLIGLDRTTLARRTGRTGRERPAGDELWIVFDLPDYGLRARLRPDRSGEPRVVSWTASLRPPVGRLSEALAPLDLWPTGTADLRAEDHSAPLVRRPLRGPDGRTHSLTVTQRAGRFSAVTVFDEPPDWTEG